MLQEQFTQLVEERRDSLFRAAFRILQEPGDSEDAVQEGVVAAYHGLSGLRDPERLESWLVSIVCNSARRLRQTRQQQTPVGDLEQVEVAVAGELEEDASVNTRRLVREALADLGDEEVQLLLARYGDESSVVNLSRDMGLPEETVRARLARARTALVDPLVRRAFESLGSSYTEVQGPRLQRRTRLHPLQVVHETPRIIVVQTLTGLGVLLSLRQEDRDLSPTLSGDGVLLDATSLYQPRVQLIRGEETVWLDWPAGLGGGLRASLPLSATAQYFKLFGVSRRSLSALKEQAAVGTAALDRQDAEKTQERPRDLGLLETGDPETCLQAALRLLDGQRREVLEEVVPQVMEGLGRRSFKGGQLEARRLAVLAFAMKRTGDLDAGIGSIQAACRLQPGCWEWQLHRADLLALAGRHSDAAVAMVKALRGDSSGLASNAVQWMPHLRPYLGIPRLWRLLAQSAESGSPNRSFIPLVPGVAVQF